MQRRKILIFFGFAFLICLFVFRDFDRIRKKELFLKPLYFSDMEERFLPTKLLIPYSSDYGLSLFDSQKTVKFNCNSNRNLVFDLQKEFSTQLARDFKNSVLSSSFDSVEVFGSRIGLKDKTKRIAKILAFNKTTDRILLGFDCNQSEHFFWIKHKDLMLSQKNISEV